MQEILKLSEVVGAGYDDFWNFEGRYRVVKGGRASKKSQTAALWFVINMMKRPEANLLVVRKTYNSLKNSCFSELKWAINRLKVSRYWNVKSSPLEISYLNGGKIYFKGLSDALKLTGITADKGKICWIWAEEAYEIASEDDFNIIDETLRGEIPPTLFKQTTITFNPWSDAHWLKKRFFDDYREDDDNVLALTTNYQCNEWLDEADKRFFENMREQNPKRFRVAGLGEWGISDGLVYENWEVKDFDFRKLIEQKRGKVKAAFGLDFGYTNDPTALCCMLIDNSEGAPPKNAPFKDISKDDLTAKKTIYVFDEMYEHGLSNRAIYEKICSMGYRKEKIFADSAEPKSIDELYSLGLTGIRKARKGADSVNYGIQLIQGRRIIIHPKCANFIKEISAYSWAKSAKRANAPKGGFDHLMDAMRYGLSESDGARWEF